MRVGDVHHASAAQGRGAEKRTLVTTIIDYVRKATTPLRTDLTPADALTLAALSYADFHALVGPRSTRGCLLSEIAQASSILALYDHTIVTKHNRALLRSGASSASC